MLTQDRFQKYIICTEMFGVHDCRHGQFHVNWKVSHIHRDIIPGFHMILTFKTCIWIYDWLETCLLKKFRAIVHQIVHKPLHGYWHHIPTSEITQNEDVGLKILTDSPKRWTDTLNRRVWLIFRLTDRTFFWTEISTTYYPCSGYNK